MKIFLAILLFISINAQGTTYYVSNAGSDAANGLTTGTSWQTIAKVNATSFVAGDIILFNRGDIWREQLTVPTSGTLGNEITYGAYGTGAKPIISAADVKTGWTNSSGNNWYITAPSITVSRGRYTLIYNGTLYTQVATVGALVANTYCFDATPNPDRIYVYSAVDPSTQTVEVTARDFCITSSAGSSAKKHLIIENFKVEYAARGGVYFEGPGESTSDALNSGTTIQGVDAYANGLFGVAAYDHYDNVLVDNCTATYNGNGFYAWVSDEVTMQYSSSSNSFAFSAGVPSDGHGFGGYQSDNCIIQHVTSDNDNDNIHIDAGGVGITAYMRYNISKNAKVGSGAPNTPCMGFGNVGAGGTMYIYYNVLISGASNALEEYTGSLGTVNIWNNTMYESNTTGTDGIFYMVHADNLNIKNNIIVRDLQGSKYNYLNWSATLPTALDYNDYYITNAGAGAKMRNYYSGGSYTTMASWRTATGKDANSLNVDPLFVNAASDWSLQSGSPCRGAGTNVGLSEDINGTTLPSTPDMGAYQYQDVATPNITVRGRRATLQ